MYHKNTLDVKYLVEYTEKEKNVIKGIPKLNPNHTIPIWMKTQKDIPKIFLEGLDKIEQINPNVKLDRIGIIEKCYKMLKMGGDIAIKGYGLNKGIDDAVNTFFKRFEFIGTFDSIIIFRKKRKMR